MVVVAFQNIFRLEMHWSNIFLIFKIYFWHQHKKQSKNIKKNNLKKNKLIFYKMYDAATKTNMTKIKK
jgi:hypothetical protein